MDETPEHPGRALGAYDPTSHDALGSLVHFAERTRGGAILRVPWPVLKDAIENFLRGFDQVGHVLKSAETTLVRARKLADDEVISNVSQLGPPPEHLRRDYGRCHTPGDAMFYAGAGGELVMSEIGAEIGDRVGLLYFKPRRPWKLIAIGIMDEFRRTSGNCPLPAPLKAHLESLPRGREGTRPFYFDAWMSDFFSRRAARDVYRLTSAFTAALMTMNPEVDGVSYSSVNHDGGACVAVRQNLFPSECIFVEVQIVRLVAEIGYGFYQWEVEAQSSGIRDGEISWRARPSA